MKKVLKIVAPVLLIAILYFAINNKPKEPVETGKKITLNFKAKEDEGYNEFAKVEYEIKDELTLGEVFDAINGKKLEMVLEGDKNSEWGRYILSINEYVSNGKTAPFWFINSETNSECLALGFCNGLDSQGLEDNDIFDIVYE